MRDTIARWLVNVANLIGDKYRYEPKPNDKFDTLSRAKMLIDQLNGTMFQVPCKYYLWTDWTTKPAKVILCEFQRGTKEVIYPVVSRETLMD